MRGAVGCASWGLNGASCSVNRHCRGVTSQGRGHVWKSMGYTGALVLTSIQAWSLLCLGLCQHHVICQWLTLPVPCSVEMHPLPPLSFVTHVAGHAAGGRV